MSFSKEQLESCKLTNVHQMCLICICLLKFEFRFYICKVLEKVLRDIKDNKKFDSLLEEVNNIVIRQESECNLEESAQMWHSEAEQLRELLESDKKANEDDRTRTIKLAQESDAQVDHTIFLNSGKLGNV